MDYPTKASVRGLVEKLGLPVPDEFSQDWEYEVADASAVEDLLDAYQSRTDLSLEEKFTLMRIIIESMNDALSTEIGPLHLTTLKRVLLEDYELHSSTLDSWADWDQEAIEDSSDMTPIVREIIAMAKGRSRSS